MPPAADPDDDEPHGAAPVYAALLRAHLADTRTHLAGRGPSALATSCLPLRAFWTPADKDAFFHGLAVHSCLRPDLVAEDVPGKSLLDVCAYLGALEEAAHGAAHLDLKDIPAAEEMSDAWVAREEELAAALHEDAVSRARSAQLPDDDGHATFAALAELLPPLEMAHLRVMDRMLREEEQQRTTGHTPARDSASESPTPAPRSATASRAASLGLRRPILDAQIDLALLALSHPSTTPLLRSSPAPPMSDNLPSVAPHHAIADPSITAIPKGLALSADAPGRATLGELNIAAAAAADPDALAYAQMSPLSRRRHQKRLYMRRKRARLAGNEVETAVERLRPGRKPRDVRTALAKGKGKEKEKTERESGEDALGEGSGEGMDVDENAETDEDASHASANEGAHERTTKTETKAYSHRGDRRVRRALESAGVDVTMLHSAGLGVLNLGALGKVMQQHRALTLSVPSSGSSSSPTPGPPSSARAAAPPPAPAPALALTFPGLHLLSAHLTWYTTALVHRALVAHTQHRAARAHTKAWRVGADAVGRASVARAVEMMGGTRGGGSGARKERWEALVERFRRGEVAEGAGKEEDGGEDEDEDEEAEDENGATDGDLASVPRGRKRKRTHSGGGGDDGGDEDVDESESGSNEDDHDPPPLDHPAPDSGHHRAIYATAVRLPRALRMAAEAELAADADSARRGGFSVGLVGAAPRGGHVKREDSETSDADTDEVIVGSGENIDIDEDETESADEHRGREDDKDGHRTSAIDLHDDHDNALDAELAADAELNVRDQAAAEAAEHALWLSLGLARPQHRAGAGAGGALTSLRFARPGTAAGVKSRVFVVDSDGEA